MAGRSLAGILRLRVRNALSSPLHIELAAVELSPELMARAGLEEEDVVKLSGRRSCGGTLFHSYFVDEESVRLPNFLQSNAGAVGGEYVSLEEANPPEAEFVILTASFSRYLRERQSVSFSRYLHERLKGVPVSEGDMVPVRSIFGPVLHLQAISVEPRQLVKVGRKTVITLKPTSEGDTTSREDDVWSAVGGLSSLDVAADLSAARLFRARETTLKGREPLRIDLRETAPRVRYDDIGGLSEQIREVREMIELSLRYPEISRRIGLKPPKGVLFIGPPGVGKTLLAKAVASSVNANVFIVRCLEFVSKWCGESEAKLREVFSDAKNTSPSMIIFDEIDSIASKRVEADGREVESRIVSTLLTVMDGLDEGGDVVVIATANNPDALDPTLRGPGRFDREMTFPAPNAEGRYEIFKIHTRDMPLAKDVDLVKMAERTHVFTGADIETTCHQAALNTIRRHLANLDGTPEALSALFVEGADFEAALRKVTPFLVKERRLRGKIL